MGRQFFKKGYESGSGLVPFSVIAAAAEGDAVAINAVLKHYLGYIIALSTRSLYDGYNSSHRCIDHELRGRLEAKFINKILTFRAA